MADCNCGGSGQKPSPIGKPGKGVHVIIAIGRPMKTKPRSMK